MCILVPRTGCGRSGGGTRTQLAILICFVSLVLSLGECLRFFIARVAAAPLSNDRAFYLGYIGTTVGDLTLWAQVGAEVLFGDS